MGFYAEKLLFQRNSYSFCLFLKHEITQYFNNDVGLIKVIYGVTKKKQDCVFGGVHLVAVSISDVGAVLWTPPRNKAGLACKWLRFHRPYST